jgi:hypothetical protein
MTVPKGNFPIPYDMDGELMDLSKEAEKAVIEGRIAERRKDVIKPENPWYRPLPPMNRR